MSDIATAPTTPETPDSGRIYSSSNPAEQAEMTAPPSVVPAPNATPEQAPIMVESGTLTAAQQAAVAEDIANLVKAGKITPEQAKAAMEATDQAPAVDPDLDVANAAVIDHEFPAARAQDFDLGPAWQGVDLAKNPEAAKLDGQVRGWMETARMPAKLGGSLANAFNDALTRRGTGDRTLDDVKQTQTLQKLYGKDFDSKIATGRAFVAEIEKRSPGLKAFLDHVGTDALSTSLIIAQAERQGMRWKAKP